MMLTTPDEDLRAQVLSAIEIVDEHHRSSSGWNEKYGHAFAFLFQILEKDLKEWIRANPPGHADYDKSTPERQGPHLQGRHPGHCLLHPCAIGPVLMSGKRAKGYVHLPDSQILTFQPDKSSQ